MIGAVIALVLLAVFARVVVFLIHDSHRQSVGQSLALHRLNDEPMPTLAWTALDDLQVARYLKGAGRH